MRMKTAFLGTLTLLALLFTGCSETAGTQKPASTSTTSPATTITPAPGQQQQQQTQRSAADLLAGLKAQQLPIGESVVFTAATDENHLLGRPGQYIGKASWHDTRVEDSGDHGPDLSVDDGGSIEVFANAADAQRRFEYVASIASTGGVFAEYDYLSGDVLLRLTRFLTPEEANQYRYALNTLP